MIGIEDYIRENDTEIDNGTIEFFLEDIMGGKLDEESLEGYIETIVANHINNRAIGEEWWDWYLYENLLHTVDQQKLIDKIQKNFSHYNITIKDKNFSAKYPQFSIICDDIKKLGNNKRFIELCDNANYEIIINPDRLIIKPIKGEEITEDVN